MNFSNSTPKSSSDSSKNNDKQPNKQNLMSRLMGIGKEEPKKESSTNNFILNTTNSGMI